MLLSSELLISKYIKSATNGRIISVRLRRILTLIVIPLWIAAVVSSGIMLYEGLSASTAVKRLTNAIREDNLQNSHSIYKQHSPYYELWEQKLSVAKDDVDYMYYSIIPLIAAFIIPWLLLRIIFWIIDADKAERSQVTK